MLDIYKLLDDNASLLDVIHSGAQRMASYTVPAGEVDRQLNLLQETQGLLVEHAQLTPEQVKVAAEADFAKICAERETALAKHNLRIIQAKALKERLSLTAHPPALDSLWRHLNDACDYVINEKFDWPAPESVDPGEWWRARNRTLVRRIDDHVATLHTVMANAAEHDAFMAALADVEAKLTPPSGDIPF